MSILKYGLAVVLLILPACEKSDDEEIYNENNTNVINGVVYDIDEKPINGIYKTYYSNGSIKMEMKAKNGLPNGDGKFFDENGNIQFSGTFENGKINGKFYQYYEDGTVHNELNYSNGIQTGAQILYDNNGLISAEVMYQDNRALAGYVIIDGEKIALETEELKDLSQNAFPAVPEVMPQDENQEEELLEIDDENDDEPNKNPE